MILICYGTRPEHIKISPLLKEMKDKIPYKTLFTGQHTDLVKNINFDFNLKIKNGNNRLDSVVQSCLNLDDSISLTIHNILFINSFLLSIILHLCCVYSKCSLTLFLPHHTSRCNNLVLHL